MPSLGPAEAKLHARGRITLAAPGPDCFFTPPPRGRSGRGARGNSRQQRHDQPQELKPRVDHRRSGDAHRAMRLMNFPTLESTTSDLPWEAPPTLLNSLEPFTA